MYLSAKCLFLFVCFFVTFSGRLSPFPPTPPPPSKEKTLPCKPPPLPPPHFVRTDCTWKAYSMFRVMYSVIHNAAITQPPLPLRSLLLLLAVHWNWFHKALTGSSRASAAVWPTGVPVGTKTSLQTFPFNYNHSTVFESDGSNWCGGTWDGRWGNVGGRGWQMAALWRTQQATVNVKIWPFYRALIFLGFSDSLGRGLSQ